MFIAVMWVVSVCTCSVVPVSIVLYPYVILVLVSSLHVNWFCFTR
jgi:hypothetical protein